MEPLKSDNSQYINGYVKLCSSWASRMWNVQDLAITEKAAQELDAATGLDSVTYQFDKCGAYDVHNDGASIPLGSEFEEWGDALSFLEWYGFPKLDGFKIVIIDGCSSVSESECTKFEQYPAFRNPAD